MPQAPAYKKSKGKVTTNLSQKDWEKIPGTGTEKGNPPRYRMKEKAKAKQQSKFKVKQAKKKEKVTKPAVEALYKGAREGAPYARLTGAVRRGAERARKEQLAKDIRSRDIDDFPAAAGPNRSMIEQLKRDEAQRVNALKERDARMARIGPPPRKPSPRILPAIPNTVPERQRQRILPRIDATPADVAATQTWGKTGGKVSKSKGGTVKKMHGGKLHKTRKTYDGHDGNKYVSKLYT